MRVLAQGHTSMAQASTELTKRMAKKGQLWDDGTGVEGKAADMEARISLDMR